MRGEPMSIAPMTPHAQRGMALLVSLVFLLVLMLIGLSSMQLSLIHI